MFHQLSFHYDKTNDRIVQYAQRAVMKSLRYIKLRTFSTSPLDLAMERNHNPLRRTVSVTKPSHDFTARYLQSFKQPLGHEPASGEPFVSLFNL